MTISHKDIKYLRSCHVEAKEFSTCAKRQYFSIVLDKHGHVLGSGYNGVPPKAKHCIDGGCPRLQNNTPNGANYDDCDSIHAEINCLLHSDCFQRQGGTLYVNGPPCFTCAKVIANSGVKRVVGILDPAYADWPRIETKLKGWGIQVDMADRSILNDLHYDDTVVGIGGTKRDKRWLTSTLKKVVKKIISFA